MEESEGIGPRLMSILTPRHRSAAACHRMKELTQGLNTIENARRRLAHHHRLARSYHQHVSFFFALHGECKACLFESALPLTIVHASHHNARRPRGMLLYDGLDAIDPIQVSGQQRGGKTVCV